MRFDVVTRASPEQVLEAMTDFTDRRLQIWSTTLDPKIYEVMELGTPGRWRGKDRRTRRSGSS